MTILQRKKAAGSHRTASQKTQTNFSRKCRATKPLPPYGRRLCDCLQSGALPDNDIFLCIGTTNDSWRKAKVFSITHYVLIYLGDLPPDNYRWPVKGCSVLCFEIDTLPYQTLRCLAYCLLKDGAIVVRMILKSKPFVVFSRGDDYEC